MAMATGEDGGALERQNALVGALVGAFAAACAAPSWLPWIRWVVGGCVLIVVLVVVRVLVLAPIAGLTG